MPRYGQEMLTQISHLALPGIRYIRYTIDCTDLVYFVHGLRLLIDYQFVWSSVFSLFFATHYTITRTHDTT